jgi:hypothetical protein
LEVKGLVEAKRTQFRVALVSERSQFVDAGETKVDPFSVGAAAVNPLKGDDNMVSGGFKRKRLILMGELVVIGIRAEGILPARTAASV